MNRLTIVLLLLAAAPVSAQLRNADVHKMPQMVKNNQRQIIRIPNIDGYQTLKCDFHTHTVFSDGLVWPTIRVDEAWCDGLDAIAITDHIEYRPRKEVVLGDLNESYKLASAKGKKRDIIVIHGIEITRSKPFGHMNALFITDAEKMKVASAEESLEQALKQNAFVMWNHPGWPNDTTTLYPIHKKLIAQKKIHGVEVLNHAEYYPKAIDWCADMGLTFMGNSDIHNTIGIDYDQRPMTLVFAKERTTDGIREALDAGRTAILFDNTIVGREDILQQLAQAIMDVKYLNDKKTSAEIANNSDVELHISTGLNNSIIAPHTAKVITIPQGRKVTLTNFLTGQQKVLEITL